MSKAFKSYTDAELINLLSDRKKESAAFSEIFERYKSLTSAYSKLYVKDHDAAEDIFQESFIRLYKTLKKKKDPQNIPGLLITICRNLSYNLKRDTKIKVAPEDVSLISEDGINFENKELLELVLMAVEFLDEKYRRAFMLREFDGYQHKEIAKVEDITIGNAKLRVRRAKQKIIEILQPYIKDLEKS